jgi:predicted metal-dependent hydrolase
MQLLRTSREAVFDSPRQLKVRKEHHGYIIAHELVHLLERNHNDRFTALMDQFMPLWSQYREELNRGPLEYGDWEY